MQRLDEWVMKQTRIRLMGGIRKFSSLSLFRHNLLRVIVTYLKLWGIPHINVFSRRGKGGIKLQKAVLNVKYKIHLFLQQYNEVLIQDAVCDKLRSQLKQKANYHKEKATRLKLST